MKLSNRMKAQIKKRLTSATAILAVLVFVFACSKNLLMNVETETGVTTVENSDGAAKNEIAVIKDSTGINLHVTGVDNSSVNSIEVFQGTTKVKDVTYTDNQKTKELDLKIEIPFGETHQITVMVNGEAVAQKDVQNMRYISSVQDLVAFRDAVNAGNKFYGKYIELLNNIDMSTVCSSTLGSWTPIGKMNSPNDLGTIYFAGTFNGNYYEISNLYINQSAVHYAGLFAYMNGGTICNLRMTNVNIYNGYNSTVSAQTRTGAIVALVSGSSNIRNCGVYSGTIQAKYTLSPGVWNLSSIGGIAGGIYGSLIDGCYNRATIISSKNNSSGCTNRVGGIAGDVASRNSN